MSAPAFSSPSMPMESATSAAYERFAGLCGVLAGLIGFGYAIAFVVLRNDLLSALFLTAGGLLISATIVAVYQHIRAADQSFALWALLLFLIGQFGAAIHGAYDLANTINVPDALPANLANLPSQIDPRGFLTFGVSGLAIFITAWLMVRGDSFPKTLGYLGYLLGALLIFIYLARLIILSPLNPILLVPVLVSGFVVNPLFYLWLGFTLWRGR